MPFYSISLPALALLVLGALTTAAQKPPKIFVSGNAFTLTTNTNILQKNIPECQFVSNAMQADVQVNVSSQKGVAGNEKVLLQFVGLKDLAGKNDSSFISFAKGKTATELQVDFEQTMQQSLVYLFHHTQWQNVFIKQGAALVDTAVSFTQNKWRNWNFIPGLSGRTENETNSGLLELNANFTARRITQNNKFIINIQHQMQRNSYTYDYQKIMTQVNSLNILPLYVRSINSHWSAGVTGQFESDEYKNIAASYRLAPVVEYNIFNYAADAPNQLRLVYQTGLINYRYHDTTIYNKTKETRGYQRLALIADLNRSWGSVRTSVQANAFLNNAQQNRITFNTLFSVNLFKGLAFNMQGQLQLVRNQISLLKHPLSDDTYLLDGQQLPTKYYLTADFGLTYTFGNTFNNMANPRMGQVDEVDF